jgi:hypothetical protein
MAQVVFAGNQQLWNNANGTMKGLTVIYGAGFAAAGAAALAPAAVELIAFTHLAVPEIPLGMSVTQFAQLLGLWARRRNVRPAAAYETLAENGITFDIVVQWGQFVGFSHDPQRLRF